MNKYVGLLGSLGYFQPLLVVDTNDIFNKCFLCESECGQETLNFLHMEKKVPYYIRSSSL